MHFPEIWIRIRGLLFTPASAWKKMKSDKGYVFETLIILLVVCFLLGFASLLRTHHGWVPEMLIPFVSCVVFSIVVRLLSPKMRKVNWEGSLNLVVYSVLPTLLAYTVTFVIGNRLFILLPAFIYSLLMLHLALYNLFGLKVGETLGFGLVCILSFFSVYYFSLLLLSI